MNRRNGEGERDRTGSAGSKRSERSGGAVDGRNRKAGSTGRGRSGGAVDGRNRTAGSAADGAVSRRTGSTGSDGRVGTLNELDKKQFLKTVAMVAVPIAVQSLIGSSLNLVDNLMIGHLGELPLNAVGVSVQIFFIYWMFVFGFASGAATYISQFFGVRDFVNIRRTTGFTLMVVFGMGMLFFLAAELFPQYLLRVFTRFPEVIDLGVTYVRTGAFCFLLVPFTQAFTVALRSTQQTVQPLIASVVALCMNTGMNYVLIYGKLGFPAMGVTGAALATVISRCVELGIILFLVFGRRNILITGGTARRKAASGAAGNAGASEGFGVAGNAGASEGFGAAGNAGASEGFGVAGNAGASEGFGAAGNAGASEGFGAAGNAEASRGFAAASGEKVSCAAALKDFFGFNRDLAIRIVKNALPTTINETMWGLGTAMYVAAFARISISAGAAVQACNTINNMFSMAAFSIGDAVLILVGQKLGEGKKDEAYAMSWILLKLAIIVGLILGGLTILFGKPILSLFDFSEEGAADAWRILIVYAATLFMEVYNGVQVTGCLRCGGDTRFAMIVEVGTVWLIGVPAAFITSLWLGWPVYAAVLAVKTEGVVKGVILTLRYRSRKWLNTVIEGVES